MQGGTRGWEGRPQGAACASKMNEQGSPHAIWRVFYCARRAAHYTGTAFTAAARAGDGGAPALAGGAAGGAAITAPWPVATG